MFITMVRIIHFLLVGSILISPLINDITYKKYILILLLYLLFQYVTGAERCGLTKLEYYLMGEDYQNGFLYRIINPVIRVPEKYFEKYLFIVHLCYIIIILYQLYY